MPSLKLLQFRLYIRRPGSVTIGLAASGVPDDALLIDDESGGAIALLDVDAHLKCHAVRSTYHLCWIEEEREPNIRSLQPDLFEEILGRVLLMRIYCQNLGTELVFPRDQSGAQLHELPVADGSRIAIDEDQYHRLLATELAQPDRLARKRGELEVRCGLPDLGRVHGSRVPVDQ